MTEETQQQAQQGHFSLQRIYVKDISFESPMAINQRSPAQPSVQQDLNTQVNKIGDEHFEVVLQLTITVKQEDKVAFLVEVHQAGLFQIKGLEGPQLQHLLSTMCPNILFPYAREAIDSMATRGGFPPLMLPPINFEGVYAQAMAEAKNRATEQENAETH
ncbi:Protein-export protein SecB [Thalassocella blandensis]|nr:Protein-export protein SecB [Thalassocella blandensis]